MTPTVIDFEERYSDDSGVEYGVYYDENKGNPMIKILSKAGDVDIPLSKVDWFIERLTYIKEKVEGT